MRGIKVKIIDGYSISTNIESIEAVVQRCSAKKVFLEISQNSKENDCVTVCFFNKLSVSFLIKFLTVGFF